MQPIPPGSNIGILGGGQLGRMLAIAAAELGYRVHIYCPEEDAPASMMAAQTTIASYDNLETMQRFASTVDVVTYEFENIPYAPVATIAQRTPVYPSPKILALSQQRVHEKQAINQLGIPTAPFRPVSSLEELKAAVAIIGLPSVLKTANMGYDGKGQAMLDAQSDLEAAWLALNTQEAILEGFIPFRMEISVIVARDASGQIATYCPVQNIHQHHILFETIAPAPISAALDEQAQQLARTIAEGMDLNGIMAVEMFVTHDETLLVNEIAPRPHNSGHWTIDACVTSQFEQTIRAICGLPLGSVERLCNARMRNLIGDEISQWPHFAANPQAKLHIYGKKEARPGRKMGHVTFLDVTP